MRKEEEFYWAPDSLFKDKWLGQKGLVLGRGMGPEYKRNKRLDTFDGKIIGCNTAFKTTKCDAVFWMETKVFNDNRHELKKIQEDGTILFAVNPHYPLYGMEVWGIEARKPARCSERFDYGFYPCQLSGYVALNIALIMGLNPVYLYGFLGYKDNEEMYKRNLNFKYIADWCEKNDRKVYVTDRRSQLIMFFEYCPLFKNTKRNS